jgi:hypothetical protein
MNRVGKLPGNGRFILLISQEEYLQMKTKGFKITDSVPLQNRSKFFDIQLSRNASTLRFRDLAKLETLIRQGKPLTPTQKSLYTKELSRRSGFLETWYSILLEIESMGYKDEYIFKVIQFAENDIPTREEMQRNSRWHGWARNLLSLNTLLKLSSNNISKWENIVTSYERQRKKSLSFFDALDEDGDFEI